MSRARPSDAQPRFAPDEIAAQRLRQRARQRSRQGSELRTQSITARVICTASGAERLLSAVGRGHTAYSLVSEDGEVALHVQLVVDSLQVAEERLGDSNVAVDWSRGVLSCGDARVRLTRTELRLLAALLEQDGEPVAHRKLVARLWPGAENASGKAPGLAVYVCGLRKRLAEIGLRNALVTVRGIGYRLVVWRGVSDD
jgi:DNA-binding response OmpR family regulator